MSYHIDISTEQVLTLSEAARSLPGGPVHTATVHRWRMRGVRGIRLPTVLLGGIRYTSREALAWWCDQTTAAADGTLPQAPPQTQRQRALAIERAKRELAADGI